MDKELSFIVIPAIVVGIVLGLRFEESGYPSWVGGLIGMFLGGRFGISVWSAIERVRSKKN